MSELPKGWVGATVAELTLPFDTVDPKREPDAEFTYVDIGSIDNTTQTITNPKTFFGRDAPSRARRVIKQGDILFSTVRTYLKNIAQVPAELDGKLTSTGISVLRPSSGLDGRYLFNWICSDDFITTMSKAQDGALYPAVNDKDVAGAFIPLPPLTEQRRIVAKVDGLTARTARARKELDSIPTLIARYKEALLTAALSGKLTAEWRQKAGIDAGKPKTVSIETPALFEMTGLSNWEYLTLNDICQIEGGSQPPKSTFTYENKTGYVRLIQIRDYKSDKHIVFIPKELARRFASKTDIMIGRYGPPIFQILRGLEGAYNVALMKAIPVEEEIDQEYLYWFLKGPTLLAYVEFGSKRSSGQDGVNKNHLLKFPVPLPPLEEQAEIVRRIESAFGWLDRVAADHAAAAKYLPKLDAAILAKAFRGELVLQDRNDEPASQLLDRIKAQRTANPKKKRRSKKPKPELSKEIQTMAKNLEEVLAEADDWIDAQEAFQRCGIGSSATTEEIEQLYWEIRKLDKAGKLEAEPINDVEGRKLQDRLRLKAV